MDRSQRGQPMRRYAGRAPFSMCAANHRSTWRRGVTLEPMELPIEVAPGSSSSQTSRRRTGFSRACCRRTVALASGLARSSRLASRLRSGFHPAREGVAMSRRWSELAERKRTSPMRRCGRSTSFVKSRRCPVLTDPDGPSLPIESGARGRADSCQGVGVRDGRRGQASHGPYEGSSYLRCQIAGSCAKCTRTGWSARRRSTERS
jgi:hypothetical protein